MNVEFDGFIGIFDDVFNEEWMDDLLEFFETSDSLGLNSHTKDNGHASVNRDMDEIYLTDPITMQRVSGRFLQYFYHELWKKIVPVYTEKFSILEGHNFGTTMLKMKRIKPGGGFHTWHYENKSNLHRKLVVQLYMNDIEDAGETEFLYQSKRFSPKRNRLLVWPADWTHTHRGNPPIGNEDKYILTTWLEHYVQEKR